ncbi:MAG: spermidine/putrescine ABC transporter substrate-binding protein [Chloroflexota bacterium]|nr:spermidine/putrescine ABC transporter substrate-binding protein [Chloroflexota bacterium]
MKKTGLLLVVMLLALPLVYADSHEYAAWTCPEGFEGQTLSIFNWSTYIAEDTVPNFEDACGVTVNYDIYESNEAMLARIRQGNPGYDLIVPSGGTVQRMAEEGLLIPLDKDMIPNIPNLIPDLLNAPYDPDNTYSLPYQWGTVGVGYRTEVFPDGITSWDQVWAHDGSVAWLDDRQTMFGIAHLFLGTDPNTTDGDEIVAARDYLLERGGNVVAVAADDGQVLLERGEVDIAIEYNGDILQISWDCECDDYAYAIPDEGSNVWIDNLAIPVDAPNPELANVFIDYILDAKVGADLTNYIWYASPNQASIESGFIDEEILNDPAIFPTPEQVANLFAIIDVGAEAEELINNAWDEMLIFLGQ